MKTLLRRKKPTHSDVEVVDQADAEAGGESSPGETGKPYKGPLLKLFRKKAGSEGGWSDEGTARAASWTTSMTWVFRFCLICAPLVLVMTVLAAVSRPTAAPPVTAPPIDAGAQQRAAVSTFAQDYVTTWLTTPRGQEARMKRFVQASSMLTLPLRPWLVDQVSTAGLHSSGDGLWSVTVAATVKTKPVEVGVRRYYAVLVRYDRGSVAAQMLPTPTSAPAAADTYDLDYPGRVATDDPVAKAADEFLVALLTGSADVSRYTSPGSSIRPIAPAVFSRLRVDDVLADQEAASSGRTAPADGQQMRLLVSAVGISGGQRISVQYALTMKARAGRWEVAEIDTTPVLGSLNRPTASQTPAADPSADSGSTN